MATKTTAPKTNPAANVSKATSSIANVSNTVSSLFGAYITSSRKVVEGVIEVDKTLLGYAKNAVDGYVALGKDTMQAKCLNDVIDLQAAHAHASIENGAANAREVVELSRTRAKEAYAPLKEVIDTYRSSNAA
ncbi:phasin family protein [Ruegeria hyattellae]|uniref:phasin family protein n=1 Tax=Ruegeria hyattellae TaxID=3233337 RepID=UPI00355C6AB5